MVWFCAIFENRNLNQTILKRFGLVWWKKIADPRGTQPTVSNQWFLFNLWFFCTALEKRANLTLHNFAPKFSVCWCNSATIGVALRKLE